jgi:hypothetical protein
MERKGTIPLADPFKKLYPTCSDEQYGGKMAQGKWSYNNLEKMFALLEICIFHFILDMFLLCALEKMKLFLFFNVDTFRKTCWEIRKI